MKHYKYMGECDEYRYYLHSVCSNYISYDNVRRWAETTENVIFPDDMLFNMIHENKVLARDISKCTHDGVTRFWFIPDESEIKNMGIYVTFDIISGNYCVVDSDSVQGVMTIYREKIMKEETNNLKYLEDIFVTRFNGYDYYLGPHSEEPMREVDIGGWWYKQGEDYVVPNSTLMGRALYSPFHAVRQEFLNVPYWIDASKGLYKYVEKDGNDWEEYTSKNYYTEAYIRLFKRKPVNG